MIDLNRNEFEAMRILWREGPLKPAEIQERFSWPIENATLRSVLRLLAEKGHLTRRKQGKAFLYKAKASRRGVLSSVSRRMAQVFTGGSAADLIAQLIKTEKLSKAEIESLRRVAEEKTSEPDRGSCDRGRKEGGRS